MRIAQVAPLWDSVSPTALGNTERMVSYLTEELVRLGHDVTLFAAGDSKTNAVLKSSCSKALRLSPELLCCEAPIYLLLERAFGTYAGHFDIIHSHIDLLGFPLARRCSTPVVTTLHNRLDWQELIPPFREYSELPLISISQAQRQPLLWANWLSTVPYGLPKDLYDFKPNIGKYLAFCGHISPEHGVESAITVAKCIDMPIRIAAIVDAADRDYLSCIEPLLNHPLVEFVGALTADLSKDFLGGAYALICPYDRPDLFDVAVIGALASGTPVLSYQQGFIPEIIEHGRTGLLCKTQDEMGSLAPMITQLDRLACRQQFEERFTVERMTQEYVSLYVRLIESHTRELTVSEMPLSQSYSKTDYLPA